MVAAWLSVSLRLKDYYRVRVHTVNHCLYFEVDERTMGQTNAVF